MGLSEANASRLLSENSAESWCAAVAAQGLGLSVTWLHPKGSLADHSFQVEDSESAAIVVSPATHAERGRDLASKCGSAVKLFSLGPFDAAPDLLQLAADSGATTAVDLAEPDDIALVHYTGGTTGRSKGAVRSNRNAVAFACVSVLADIELPEVPHYLAIAPNSHAGGTMLLPTWRRGGTVHTVSKFEPDRVFNAIEKGRINITFLVPTMLYALLDHLELARNDIGSLQCIYYGAAPASPAKAAAGDRSVGADSVTGIRSNRVLPDFSASASGPLGPGALDVLRIASGELRGASVGRRRSGGPGWRARRDMCAYSGGDGFLLASA